jgi:DtxR family Mn-dependent transcriptional regulator
MPLEESLQIVHMEDEPEAVYAQLVAEGLHPGMQVQISEKSPHRIRFWANGEEHLLAPIVAASISVRSLPEQAQEIACSGRPLHSLKPGQSGTVASLSPRLRGAERRRMMDLGVLPGTVIRAEITSPAGDPTAYRIRGALIALRREQADFICIQPLGEIS